MAGGSPVRITIKVALRKALPKPPESVRPCSRAPGCGGKADGRKKADEDETLRLRQLGRLRRTHRHISTVSIDDFMVLWF
jgi:hypothetical protein